MTPPPGPDTLNAMHASLRGERGRGVARLLLVLLALALVASLWLALRPGGPLAPKPAGAPPTPEALSATDSAGSDADIERALEMARAAAPGGVDSTAIKNAWHDDVAGVDLEGLTPGQRSLFVRFANAERCTCGCGYTLAGCLASDMTCEVSRAKVTALLDSVRAGQVRGARGVRERPPGD